MVLKHPELDETSEHLESQPQSNTFSQPFVNHSQPLEIDLPGFMAAIGLSDVTEKLVAEEIDMITLTQFGEDEFNMLKTHLGLTLGKIMKLKLALKNRQQVTSQPQVNSQSTQRQRSVLFQSQHSESTHIEPTYSHIESTRIEHNVNPNQEEETFDDEIVDETNYSKLNTLQLEVRAQEDLMDPYEEEHIENTIGEGSVQLDFIQCRCSTTRHHCAKCGEKVCNLCSEPVPGSDDDDVRMHSPTDHRCKTKEKAENHHNYHCPKCSKAFRTMAEHEQHMMGHSKFESFSEISLQSDGTLSNLLLDCKYCENKFENETDLRDHVLVDHTAMEQLQGKDSNSQLRQPSQ